MVAATTVANVLMQQADCILPGGILHGNTERNAEYFKDGMHQVMTMSNDCEAVRVLLRDEDPDL